MLIGRSSSSTARSSSPVGDAADKMYAAVGAPTTFVFIFMDAQRLAKMIVFSLVMISRARTRSGVDSGRWASHRDGWRSGRG